MRHPSQKTGATGALFRKQGQTFGVGFYLFLSLVIFISSMIETDSMNKARRFVGDVISPVIEGLGTPIIWTNDGLHWFDNVVRVFKLNQELRAENQTLKEWVGVAQVLSLENRRLKELLSGGDFGVSTLVTARVIGVTGGPYVRSLLIDKGHADGIRDGRPVVDENGVVGRAILTGNSSARVLMINDLNSRVPVRVERTNQNAMVVGQNDDMMRLMFYPVDADIRMGDRLFTSGNGRAYPPDLLVAIVTHVESDNIIVSPAADLNHLDFIRVLDYDAIALEPRPEGDNQDQDGGTQ
ncbi:MAG: rod shape-determining protein MreC [Sphingomonadales bacterium]|nr:rod shape-determining protein MreC [Sphingomonadales bacterium]